MNLTRLTGPHLITVQTQFADRDTAIHALACQLEQAGKLHDKAAFLAAVMAREAGRPVPARWCRRGR
ncbi:PTS sugar transporter subunit IIA [Aeromonas cavernicola]|uniref:PTS sugar transporter subunit IIA n=1 Tax=Aeromonas cavernicola TaxID=1006623 RepID=UPI0012FE5CFD|nr:PTS sugar transporter subunit IIA [Aeromonas cavernicola]